MNSFFSIKPIALLTMVLVLLIQQYGRSNNRRCFVLWRGVVEVRMRLVSGKSNTVRLR